MRRSAIAVTMALCCGCSDSETNFTLGFTFRGQLCGGRDLLNRQRVGKIEYKIYAANDPTTPAYEETFPCSEQELELSLDRVAHVVVVHGWGDDGKLCWDTGVRGQPFSAATAEAAIVDVPAICVFNDAVRLTVEVTGPGSVTAEPSGINCPSLACEAVYDRFAGVRLTAKPEGDAVFVGWSSNCGGASEKVTIPMFSERHCTATFADPERADWSDVHSVPGPSFGDEWDIALELDGPLLVHASDGAISASSARGIPAATSDWANGTIAHPSAGGVLASPRVAVEANGRARIAAGFESSSGCGFELLSRASSDDAFEVGAEVSVQASPCRATAVRAIAPIGNGAVLVAVSDAANSSLIAHTVDGAGEVRETVLFASPVEGALRSTSEMVLAAGRPAIAFSVFDRDRERGEVWIALARAPQPATRDDWSLHPVFGADGRTIDIPSLLVDGGRFTLAFATILGSGRETEERSMYLAMSNDLAPGISSDWTIATVDPSRGGAASVLRHGTRLVVAYGHVDRTTERATIVVADTVESTPLGPGYFAFSELDETALVARPRLLGLGGRLSIVYAQGGVTPLVFRAKY
jgi:hypothetical protein